MERREAGPTDTQHIVNLSGYVWAAQQLESLGQRRVLDISYGKGYETSVDRSRRKNRVDRLKVYPRGCVGLTLRKVWECLIGNSIYPVNAERARARGFREDAAGHGWMIAAYSLMKLLLLVLSLIVLAIWSGLCHRTRWWEFLPLYLFPIGFTAGSVPFTVEAGRSTPPMLPCLSCYRLRWWRISRRFDLLLRPANLISERRGCHGV